MDRLHADHECKGVYFEPVDPHCPPGYMARFFGPLLNRLLWEE